MNLMWLFFSKGSVIVFDFCLHRREKSHTLLLIYTSPRTQVKIHLSETEQGQATNTDELKMELSFLLSLK